MEDNRPTRWQKAKADWPGIRAQREAVVGLAGAVATAAVEALIGSGGSIDTLIAAAVGAVVTVVVFPLADLTWCWLQAPMRLLTDEVIAIREQVEQLSPSSTSGVAKPEVDVRLTLMNHKRVGEEMDAEPAFHKSEAVAQVWTSRVLDFLSEHMPRPDVEQFMTAGTGTAIDRLRSRLGILEDLIRRLDEQAPIARD